MTENEIIDYINKKTSHDVCRETKTIKLMHPLYWTQDSNKLETLIKNYGYTFKGMIRLGETTYSFIKA